MPHIRYRIPMISVAALTAFAKEIGEDVFSYTLNKSETDSVIMRNGTPLQDDNAVFFQTMCIIKGEEYIQPKTDTVIEDLSDIILYFDFAGIFDKHSSGLKKAIRSKKAESLFRPEGVTLDFGNGPHRYLAFERSASMSRNARLSFVREDVYEPLKKRIMLGLDILECQLSKLYAYNGLMFSSGIRAELPEIFDPGVVVVVDNPKAKNDRVNVITVEDEDKKGSMRHYNRTEKITTVEITEFDGEGLISPALAEKLDKICFGRHAHHSFQIRMPYIKGMVHEVDFKAIYKEANSSTIRDIWGNFHDINGVEMILTKSQFKGYSWLDDEGKAWDYYRLVCQHYRHALYVTNVSKETPEDTTELNYQFLNTISVTAEDFRPSDLPLGWSESPDNDTRHWLTKETEKRYYQLVADKEYQLQQFKKTYRFFDKKDKDYYLSNIVSKNPKFLGESAYAKQLEVMADKVLKQYSVGRLLVSGDNRFLSGDLMKFLYYLLQHTTFSSDLLSETFRKTEIYAPSAVYGENAEYTLLRSPHIARNEEIMATPLEKVGYYRNKYLSHLSDVVMIDTTAFLAERMGGADYDGDMVKTISDPIVIKSVKGNFTPNEYDSYSKDNSMPLLLIPSAEPQIADANDWKARMETVKSTFSSRVGQISNAALNRSIIAYDENADSELKERCRKETEALAILTGLEIDSAKSGIKPNLSSYLEMSGIKRSRFLKYKDLMEKAEQKRKWYEDDFATQYKNFFASTNWDSVTSNVEKLPYFAYMLKKNTPKRNCKIAKPEELFTFAVKKDWKKTLKADILEKMKTLIDTYNSAIRRLGANKYAVVSKSKHKDIDRILYIREQEAEYDSDTLYGLFVGMDAGRIKSIRKALTAERWHLLPEEERYLFLNKYLPEEQFAEYHDLFADFRNGGYRVLGDIICDIDDELDSVDHSRLHFETDSETMARLINAYENKSFDKTDREALAECAREILKEFVSPSEAVKYAVAQNKRNFMWDVLTPEVDKWVLKVRDEA